MPDTTMTFKIVSKASGKVLDVKDGALHDRDRPYNLKTPTAPVKSGTFSQLSLPLRPLL
jgi:hypothetical protein